MLLNSSSKNSQMQCNQYINGKKKYGIDNAKDQKRKSPSPPVLCSIPSDGKRTKYGSPDQNDRVDFCSISRQDYSHLSDVEDYAKRPNYLMNEENFYIHAGDLMDNSYSYDIATSIKEKLKEEDMEFADSRKKFLPSRGSHLPRPFIPIGPRFQAEVPKWEASTNIKQYDSDDCLRWLGTQIWPMPSLSRNDAKSIEKGRSDSSSGENLESIDRVKKHGEARECLKSKVNDTFSSWKFDIKKEDVSKSWTMEEEKKFEYLVKLNQLSSDTKFWKLTMEYFPSKSIECMKNYYYNVYIPRCMSIENKISL
ncbi:AT-rich interactive domain-containing protein 2-like isoform X2 [Vicia villosa]|uniref:AT-rich interactive domain-containing protein 2-like isoform X2 n=1 Tax=Vicia villosa TaxID=3911 RepID=UPI00273B422A|nr:AT-rich interactive domain-containing protein 2-like isoform X2 [Vicia villosa]